jgi:acetylornithine deacetylase
MAIDVDAAWIEETLSAFVRTNSVNPAFDASAPGEAGLATAMAAALDSLRMKSRVHDHAPGRASVAGVLAGAGSGRSLNLNGHIDTVGVAGMGEPFSGAVRDGRLYGRGSYDMKGGVVACLGAVKALQDAGVRLAGDLVVTGVADEEEASIGMLDLVERYLTDGAIVTEPTGNRVCVAHKGFVWIEIVVAGKAAHGSRYDLGIDANMRMGRVLARLAALESGLRSGSGHALVGPPSLHAAVLAGGSAPSVYASSSSLTVERRTIPGESADDAEREIEAILNACRAEDATFEAVAHTVLVREPFEVSREADIVGCVMEGVRDVTGDAPPVIGDTPWMDAAILAAHGVETVVIGPAGAGAHADEEWVDVGSVVELAAILAHAAQRYCGVA